MPLDWEPNLETGPITKEAEGAAVFEKSLVATSGQVTVSLAEEWSQEVWRGPALKVATQLS